MFAFFIGPFILSVAGWAFATGVSHALEPRERKLATLRLLSLTSIFALLSATSAGLVSTCMQVAEAPIDANALALLRFSAAALAETLAAPMIGFALLATAWLAATLGIRKQL